MKKIRRAIRWIKNRMLDRRNYRRTLWTPIPKLGVGGNLLCAKCGGDYDNHGAPEYIAKRYKLLERDRHLICHRPPKGWRK